MKPSAGRYIHYRTDRHRWALLQPLRACREEKEDRQGRNGKPLPEPTYRRFAEASRGRVFAQRSSTEAKPATSSPAR